MPSQLNRIAAEWLASRDVIRHALLEWGIPQSQERAEAIIARLASPLPPITLEMQRDESAESPSLVATDYPGTPKTSMDDHRTEDVCPKNDGGRHVPDWNTIKVRDDIRKLHIGVECERCAKVGKVFMGGTMYVDGVEW